MGNYSPAWATLKRGFVEECKLGMRYETTMAQAKKEFKGRLRVAALGAIEKPDDSFRILSDGALGVKLNNATCPAGFPDGLRRWRTGGPLKGGHAWGTLRVGCRRPHGAQKVQASPKRLGAARLQGERRR
ncbi:unnamed protein product [Polarella glacialis]|uniref:Uncharacterized protein n=1 Tax=Polarella glacialis TaxID=89957 RepID=A0A813KKM6_POLGL|nr:unnamed protein product [Polarella glacialis]CAE8707095.1 unnamed protein product [Polarella glacialis]